MSLNDRGASKGSAISKNRKIQDLRTAVLQLAGYAKLPRDVGYLSVQLHYRPAMKRGRDSDNLVATAKAIYDAFTPARAPHLRDQSVVPGRIGYGMIADDQPQHMGKPEPRLHDPDPTQSGSLWLEIDWYPARPEAGGEPLAPEFLALARLALDGADRAAITELLTTQLPRYMRRHPQLATALAPLL